MDQTQCDMLSPWPDIEITQNVQMKLRLLDVIAFDTLAILKFLGRFAS